MRETGTCIPANTAENPIENGDSSNIREKIAVLSGKHKNTLVIILLTLGISLSQINESFSQSLSNKNEGTDLLFINQGSTILYIVAFASAAIILIIGRQEIQNKAEDVAKNIARKTSNTITTPLIFTSFLAIAYLSIQYTGRDPKQMFLDYIDTLYLRDIFNYLVAGGQDAVNASAPEFKEFFVDTHDLDDARSGVKKFADGVSRVIVFYAMFLVGYKMSGKKRLHPNIMSKVTLGLLLFGFALHSFYNWNESARLSDGHKKLPHVIDDIPGHNESERIAPPEISGKGLTETIFNLDPQDFLDKHIEVQRSNANDYADKILAHNQLNIPQSKLNIYKQQIIMAIMQAVSNGAYSIKILYGYPGDRTDFPKEFIVDINYN